MNVMTAHTSSPRVRPSLAHARRVALWLLSGWSASLGLACGGSQADTPTTAAKALGQGPFTEPGDPRCDATVRGREFSEFDTSGDDVPDVRKVYMRVGDTSGSRLVMICRQADVNHDGKRDVVRLYDDDGRPTREEADRNFDGKIDQVTQFQTGEIAVNELDNDFDGAIDTKIYYDKGQPIRAERDLRRRSTEGQWKPDRWEYFSAGKLVRMGTDMDGDSRVDHWDRDMVWKREQDAAKAQSAPENAD